MLHSYAGQFATYNVATCEKKRTYDIHTLIPRNRQPISHPEVTYSTPDIQYFASLRVCFLVRIFGRCQMHDKTVRAQSHCVVMLSAHSLCLHVLLFYSINTISDINRGRAGHIARMGENRNAYRALVGKPEGKRPLGRPRRRWVDNIKMDLRLDGMVWTGSNRFRIGTSGELLWTRWWTFGFLKIAGYFLNGCTIGSFSGRVQLRK
jgi:hypothetical protein